jgi:3-oxoacyl-[acyl-carrier protein] reductase
MNNQEHREKPLLDLTGKVALITGGSRGIGRETVRLFAAAGARVAFTWIADARSAEELVAELGAGTAVAIRADIGDPEETRRMIDETVGFFGRLDILVNNAATFSMNRFDRQDYDDWVSGWRRTLEVNLLGAANAAFLAMRVMRAQGGGRIINVASRAAFRGETEFADYGASKAAVVNLTVSMARACAADGIITSCVAPGFVATDMAAAELAARREEIEREIPIGRVATVRDVAGAILYLASPWGDYLNGTTIDVNGGSWFR